MARSCTNFPITCTFASYAANTPGVAATGESCDSEPTPHGPARARAGAKHVREHLYGEGMMRRVPRWLAWHGVSALVAVFAVGAAGMAPAAAATGPVAATPAAGTPQLVTTAAT